MSNLSKRLREWIPGSAFSKKLVDEGADALDAKDKALAWYQERAKSMNAALRVIEDASKTSHERTDAGIRAEAIMVELSLDAGARAMEAMNESDT